jgi:peptidoglycan/xylan/chitin deacetylase (PgdA/CDA1 family)
MIGPLLRVYSGAGPRARLSILIFHRVLDERDPLFPETPDIAEFRATMRWVRQWFNVLALDEAVDRLRAASLPPAALVITFDDGYADNVTNAARVLAEQELTATFFICTGFLDGGRMWNDSVIEAIRYAPDGFVKLDAAGLGTLDVSNTGKRRSAIDFMLRTLKHLDPNERDDRVAAIIEQIGVPLRADLMMRSHQVRELRAAGMSVGAHTVSHPILARIEAARAEHEIAGGRDRLRELTGEPVRLFAYPNGVPGSDFNDEHVNMVRRLGFKAACTTAWGAASVDTDPLQLPRFTPWDRSALRFGMRMIGNLRRASAAVAA